jgi:hypothetical protein
MLHRDMVMMVLNEVLVMLVMTPMIATTQRNKLQYKADVERLKRPKISDLLCG